MCWLRSPRFPAMNTWQEQIQSICFLPIPKFHSSPWPMHASRHTMYMHTPCTCTHCLFHVIEKAKRGLKPSSLLSHNLCAQENRAASRQALVWDDHWSGMKAGRFRLYSTSPPLPPSPSCCLKQPFQSVSWLCNHCSLYIHSNMLVLVPYDVPCSYFRSQNFVPNSLHGNFHLNCGMDMASGEWTELLFLSQLWM